MSAYLLRGFAAVVFMILASGSGFAQERYDGGFDAPYPPPSSGQQTYGGQDYYPPSSGQGDSFSEPGEPYRGQAQGGYGEPYAPPNGAPPTYEGDQAYRPPPGGGYGNSYGQSEIISTGHQFFGSVSTNLAKAVEYVFSKQGRPNGYILGEDAGGAFIVGLRYGEGMLYTKDAGDHKVFWQGPSIGYDAGAEGSKTMVLVYNLHDPRQIYERFGGIQGSAYLVGGVSVQFQQHNNVMLAVIRSGVGLRLGANIGYLKYTRRPTWNPL